MGFGGVMVTDVRQVGSEADRGGSRELSGKTIHIPMDKLQFSFSRSSGPGGQNVNKLNTKAELRFNVDGAVDDWIPRLVAGRLKHLQAKRINSNGELLITAQEHRTQNKNKEVTIDKLRRMLAEASVEPKDRRMWDGLGSRTKAIRRSDKRHRSEVKANRRSSKADYD